MPNFDMDNFEPLREPFRLIVDSEKNPTFLKNGPVVLLKEYPNPYPFDFRPLKKGSVYSIVKCGDYVQVSGTTPATTVLSERSKDGCEWCCVNLLDFNDMDDDYFAYIKAEDLRNLSEEDLESLMTKGQVGEF